MSRVAPARDAAYHALHRVNAGSADLPDSIAAVRERLADERDRGLASEIVTGTLRWQLALDTVIARVSGRPLARLDPEVLDILRLSTYQLLHLDRVPARAVVNDAVELVRIQRKPSAAGFVNAVLRKVAAAKDSLPLPARPESPGAEDALDYLSLTLSHPRWLVERWLQRWGFEDVERWARFDNSPAPLTLRVNAWRGSRDEVAKQLEQAGVATRPTRWAPDGLEVIDGNPLRTPLAEGGLFAVQDESSQLVALAVGAREGERILDACASPGGKTLAMVGHMADRGLVVAGDLRPRRVSLLRETLAASGARSSRVLRLDARGPLPFMPTFDAVLLDAPCSGLGTIRRDPEIRWRRSDADLRRFAAAQLEMLDNACQAVRPGGRLVYSTCSSEPEENEQVVAAFLEAHPAFETRSPAAPLLQPVVDSAGHLRTWPHRHGLEAFFAAVMVRKD